MSLDKAIEHGKEHRKQYTGSKSFDYSCRNHGDCPCCKANRLFKRGNGQITMAELDDDYDENSDKNK